MEKSILSPFYFFSLLQREFVESSSPGLTPSQVGKKSLPEQLFLRTSKCQDREKGRPGWRHRGWGENGRRPREGDHMLSHRGTGSSSILGNYRLFHGKEAHSGETSGL